MRCRLEKEISIWFSHDAWIGRWIRRAPWGGSRARDFRTAPLDQRARELAELGQKRAGKFGRWSFQDMYAIFPNLEERQHNAAGVLSGGEQQMLAMCRTLMGDPSLVIIDEPTEGLAPMLVAQVGRLPRTSPEGAGES